MTGKRYNFFFGGIILGFMALAFLVAAVFPAVEWWMYLIVGGIFVVLLLFVVNPILSKRITEVISDERTNAIFGRAAGSVYRIMSSVLLPFGCIAMQFRLTHPRLFIAGLTAWSIYMIQFLLCTLLYSILKRRGE